MVSVVPQHGQTALIFAVEELETETVKTLLAAGADVNLQEKVNKTRAIYIDSAACVYHSLSSTSTFHILEKLSVTNFESLSHTLNVVTSFISS